MSDIKEYIKGDKHVHQAGSVMIKFAQYNVQGQQGYWKRQEAQEAEELEKEFADFEEVVDETKAETTKKAAVKREQNEVCFDSAEREQARPKVKTEVKPDLPPADVFVNRVMAIVKEAAKKNGETIPAKPRGQVGEYVFFVDSERIVKMMDDLRRNHETKINEFLCSTSKYDGVMIVAPFIGKLLKMEELRARDLQLTDLEFAFAPYYNKPASAVRRLSDKMDSAEANILFGLLEGMLKKYPKS